MLVYEARMRGSCNEYTINLTGWMVWQIMYVCAKEGIKTIFLNMYYQLTS